MRKKQTSSCVYGRDVLCPQCTIRANINREGTVDLGYIVIELELNNWGHFSS